MVIGMKDNYEFGEAVKNPYINKLPANSTKKQITININLEAIEYFREQSELSGIPYQTLINLYLTDCARTRKQLKIVWK